MKKYLFLILSIFLFGNQSKAQYAIKGNINIGSDWQPKIYLAAINKLSDYYRTNPDMIINTAAIDEDGHFILTGDNLPDDRRYYRLYIMKTHNTDYDACLYVGGDDHNFVHIILDNKETVEIITDSSSTAPFGQYETKGSKGNQLMQNLSDIVFPSFYFYRIKFPTQLKFSEDRFHSDLKQFADTCTNTLVSLAAINNTDFDQYFDDNKTFYTNFGARLSKDLPNSIYTKNYLLKVKYYANEEKAVLAIPPYWIAILMLFIIFLIIYNLNQKRQFQKDLQVLKNQQSIAVPSLDLDQLLTQKEKEILELIYHGNSNKEIANAIFIELSTVKTHINNIYSKIRVSNRKEAHNIAKQLFDKKV